MKKLFLILDNGHGNDTPGKRSPDGRIMEWSYTRDIARKVQERLNEIGIENHILVPEDNDVPLGNKNSHIDCRVKRANEIIRTKKLQGYESLLISIHLNAAGNSGWSNASGFSTWVAPNAGDKSKLFASICEKEAIDKGLKGNRSVPKDHFWVGNFAIIRETSCPAVLLECLFQDNMEDVEYLFSDKGKETIADIIVNSIVKYATV